MPRPLARLLKEAPFVLLFTALSCAYFYFAFTEGRLLAFEDGLTIFYPMSALISDMAGEGSLPLWNPYTFSGYPLLGAIQYGLMHPLRIIQHVFLTPEAGYNFGIISSFALSGYFTFLFARLAGARTLPAIASGVVFSFLCFPHLNVNHVSDLLSSVWLPLILFAIEKLRQTMRPGYVALLAFASALEIFSGHPQMTFYTFMLAGLYIVFFSLHTQRGMRMRFLMMSAAGLLLGIVIALPQLVSTYELSQLAWRRTVTYEFFSLYSFPLTQIPTILFPDFFHGASGRYWGPDTLVKGSEGYAATLPLIFAVFAFALLRKSRPQVKFWGLVAALAFVLALGDNTPLHKLMYHVPGYNLFRAPSKNWFEVGFAISVLTGLGLNALLYDTGRARQQAGLFAGICLVAALTVPVGFYLIKGPLMPHLGGLGFIDPSHALSPGVLSLGNPAFYVPLLLILACAGGAVGAAFPGVRFNFLKYLLIAALAAEVLYYRPTPATFLKPLDLSFYSEARLFKYLRADRPGRVGFFVDTTIASQKYGAWLPPLFPLLHRVSMLDGIDPLILNDYHELLDMRMAGISTSWPRLIRNNSILSMLNTKYIAVFEFDEKRKYIERFEDLYEKAFSEDGFSVYENKKALPRAYSIKELVPADNIAQVKGLFYSGSLNPALHATLMAKDIKGIGQSLFEKGSVSITEYLPGRVRLKADFSGIGFVVLADQYYPGWRATVDGAPTRIYKTNGVLRGVLVPAGSHEVVFTYVPYNVYVTLALSLLVVLLLLAFVIKDILKNRMQEAPQDTGGRGA